MQHGDCQGETVADIEIQLRRAILAAVKSGRTLYAISRQADTNYSVLRKFVRDEGGISLMTAKKLAALLGLELK